MLGVLPAQEIESPKLGITKLETLADILSCEFALKFRGVKYYLFLHCILSVRTLWTGSPLRARDIGIGICTRV